MALLRLVVDATNFSATDLLREINAVSTDPVGTGNRLANLIRKLSNAFGLNTMAISSGATRSTATLTISSTGPANAQTVQICGTTFTAATTPSGANDFQRSDTAATAAANLAALINTVDATNRPKVNASVTASANGGVVTLTSKGVGAETLGLHVAAVGTFANTVISNFAGGSSGTTTSLSNL